jgi:hypothetical protein
MNSLEFQEKAHRTLPMNTAQYSTKKRRFAISGYSFLYIMCTYLLSILKHLYLSFYSANIKVNNDVYS